MYMIDLMNNNKNQCNTKNELYDIVFRIIKKKGMNKMFNYDKFKQQNPHDYSYDDEDVEFSDDFEIDDDMDIYPDFDEGYDF